ncbi:MAG: fatty acyl-AMP ligase [Parvibaculaceae bacterium]
MGAPDNVVRLFPTTRANRNLPLRLGGFPTLAEALDYAAQGDTGFDFYSARGVLEHVLPYRELRRRALLTAERLLACGLTRGERVGVVAETGPDFMAVFFGCQYAGLVPCPMPYSIHIGGREAYVERIRGMLASAHASAAVGPEDLSGHLRDAAKGTGARTVLSFGELEAVEATGEGQGLEPFRADEVAYIQYSSGSTSHPKGVLIDQKAICANGTGILRHGLKVREGDRAFSWLPLYHDMGLVGFCITPMMGQVTVDYLSTPSFARRPALWLKLMSDNGCTISYSPSFGYDLAARRVNGGAKDLDLSGWRVAGIGGDMVRADILEAFSAHMKPAGFDPTAFLPSYGMAESTLAITFVELEQPIRVDIVDRAHCKLSRRALPAGSDVPADRRRSFVVCGKPLPGHTIEVRDGKGRRLSEREIGHVLVKGPSLMAGYFRNAEATAAVMGADGFMDTGDMGYLLDGEIVITGRAKDLILHNGRNIWPQDIEWSVEQIEPLKGGDVAAFSVEGTDGDEQVVVLVQCRLAAEDQMEELRRQVAAIVHRSAGVECEVVLVPPKSLPFTSSGKLSRVGAKARYLSGDIAEISGITLGHRRARPAAMTAAAS